MSPKVVGQSQQADDVLRIDDLRRFRGSLNDHPMGRPSGGSPPKGSRMKVLDSSCVLKDSARSRTVITFSLQVKD